MFFQHETLFWNDVRKNLKPSRGRCEPKCRRVHSASLRPPLTPPTPRYPKGGETPFILVDGSQAKGCEGKPKHRSTRTQTTRGRKCPGSECVRRRARDGISKKAEEYVSYHKWAGQASTGTNTEECSSGRVRDSNPDHVLHTK